MRIRLRRGTAAQWAAANPVLEAGEPGIATDTGQMFFGDGVTAFSGLTAAVLVAPDATATVKGILKLTGDLGGTSASPTVPGLALAAQKSANLSDLANATTARGNLGLGGAAVLAVGTTAGTVAAGDDSRIVGAIPKSTVTTKGDILAATGNATPDRLQVGTNGYALTADSGATPGVAWAASTHTSAWAAYSPADGTNVLQASTTNPTQGSSTYFAEYLRVHPKLIQVRFKVTVNTGGGWNAGSGSYRIMLPGAYPTMTTGSSNTTTGVAYLNDSGTALEQAILYANASTTWMEAFRDTGSAITQLGSAGPGTSWATGDYIAGTFQYEPA